MARLREFDLEEVLNKAMDTFWHRGYEATSLADLMAATGLQKGSIYKAFKDKRSLFLQALEHYLNQAYQFHSAEIAQDFSSEKERLKHWLKRTLEVYGGYGDSRGCFGVNSLVELAPHDEAIKTLLQHNQQRLQGLLTETIQAGQATGELRQDATAQELAQLLLYLLNGMFLSLKASVSPKVIQQQADRAIALLL